MKRFRFIVFCLIFGLASASSFAADFVVVANPKVAEDSVSKSELKHIYMINQTNWKNGEKITIVVLSPEGAGADDLTREYMSMSAIQAKKYWLIKVFNGVLPSLPIVVDTADEAIEKVLATKGAIAIVPKATKVGKAKVLSETP